MTGYAIAAVYQPDARESMPSTHANWLFEIKHDGFRVHRLHRGRALSADFQERLSVCRFRHLEESLAQSLCMAGSRVPLLTARGS
jgi:hypothetical protein